MSLTPTITGFPTRAKAITPSDTVNLTDADGNEIAQHVYVGGDGDVVVIPVGNDDADTVTFSLVAKDIVPVQVKRVMATSTTATGLIGLF